MRARGTAVTRLGTAIGVIVAGLAIGGPAAHAAGWTELQALATCDPSGPPITVQLDVDVEQTADGIDVTCDATIDLAGRTVWLDHIAVVAPATLTITDSSQPSVGQLFVSSTTEAGIGVPFGATLVVTSGSIAAEGFQTPGIGGDVGETAGTIIIDGGTVSARTEGVAAAIGGASQGDGGTVIINGGTVTAVAHNAAGAAIGGGGSGAGGVVTITAGVVNATSSLTIGTGGAGIGGGVGGAGATVTISGGEVTAVAQGSAAGIGSGSGGFGEPPGFGGQVTITGGRVHASAAKTGAGIGGGSEASPGPIVVTGGTVVATSAQGAGIGPGCFSSGSERIHIGAGATVTATTTETGGCLAPPVGSGGPAPSLVVAGELRLAGELVVDVPANAGGPAPVLVQEGGLISGLETDRTGGSGFSGDGTIDNHGVIAFEPLLVQVPVNDHSFLHTFQPDAGSPSEVLVFAPTFASGFRTAPAPTTPGARWVVDDPADRRWWDPTEELTGPVALVEETPAVQSVTVTAPGTATAGTPVAIDATAFDQYGPADPQPALTYTSTIPTDTFSGNQLVATAAGTRSVIVTDLASGQTATVQITVVAGPAASLHLVPSATSVDQGGSVTFNVSATDAFDNPVDTTGTVLTSSVATDQITGLTVHFPTASPHVITGTLGTITASVTIDVVPAAAPPPEPTTTTTTTTTEPAAPPELPATGGGAAPFTTAAALAVVIGALGVIVSRRRITNRPS